ncbi:MAG TPA: tetratricopeptide repeat protein [Syntrophomonadaceae bacterium]|nr:tetratricopeptide repeat protein [Syntrophomonadaceae bacterium]
MIFRLNDRQRNCLFVIILGLVLAVIVYALTAGHRQDQAFRANYHLYQQAIALMSEGQYDQALQNFKSLDANSQATYQVLYMSAFCESQTGDYAAAASHMQMAQEARPALVQDPKFLQRYGVILFNLGRLEDAFLYLEESLKYPSDPATVEETGKYLDEINNDLRGGA